MRILLSATIVALVLAVPAQARLAPADRAAINRTLDAFVATAVRRHDVAASFDLVTPQERGGMTRAAWAKGDIPVYPYPARGASWHGWTLDYALPKEVAFEPVNGAIQDRIDDAYRAKYKDSEYLQPMIGTRARSATVKVTPR